MMCYKKKNIAGSKLVCVCVNGDFGEDKALAAITCI